MYLTIFFNSLVNFLTLYGQMRMRHFAVNRVVDRKQVHGSRRHGVIHVDPQRQMEISHIVHGESLPVRPTIQF